MNDDWRKLFNELQRDGRLRVFDPENPVRPEVIVGSLRMVIPSSEPATCADCGKTVYLSDTREMLKIFPDVPVVCLLCADRRIEKEN